MTVGPFRTGRSQISYRPQIVGPVAGRSLVPPHLRHGRLVPNTSPPSRRGPRARATPTSATENRNRGLLSLGPFLIHLILTHDLSAEFSSDQTPRSSSRHMGSQPTGGAKPHIWGRPLPQQPSTGLVLVALPVPQWIPLRLSARSLCRESPEKSRTGFSATTGSGCLPDQKASCTALWFADFRRLALNHNSRALGCRL